MTKAEKKNGCTFVRHGKGDHDIWFSPISNRPVTVDSKIKSRHTANEIKMLMMHFLEEDFAPEYPEMVAGVRSEEYYVNMMIAWYFATALAKQWDEIIPYIENNRLDTRTHNKTIQKAVESNRITSEQKDYLRGLRMPRQSK